MLGISAEDCNGSDCKKILYKEERTEGVMLVSTCGKMQRTGLTSAVVTIYGYSIHTCMCSEYVWFCTELLELLEFYFVQLECEKMAKMATKKKSTSIL